MGSSVRESSRRSSWNRASYSATIPKTFGVLSCVSLIESPFVQFVSVGVARRFVVRHADFVHGDHRQEADEQERADADLELHDDAGLGARVEQLARDYATTQPAAIREHAGKLLRPGATVLLSESAVLSESDENLTGATMQLSYRDMVLVNQRLACVPMEPRGVVAQWDARADRLTVWDTTQAPIPIRNGLAALLGLPGVGDVQDQVGVPGLLESRLERLDELVREAPDETDGVDQDDVLTFADADAA